MTPEKPFEGANFDRLSFSNMEALDFSKMLDSLTSFQRKFILTDNQAEIDKGVVEEWDTLALAALELAETAEDIMKVENFSRMGSEAKLEAERLLSIKKDIAA